MQTEAPTDLQLDESANDLMQLIADLDPCEQLVQVILASFAVFTPEQQSQFVAFLVKFLTEATGSEHEENDAVKQLHTDLLQFRINLQKFFENVNSEGAA